MSLQVTKGLIVEVIPSSNYSYLLSSQDVASGFGVSRSTVRNYQSAHDDEIIEGKHFVKGVLISDTLPKGTMPHAVFWTKRGIVRLGFFIKSERAKLFRDWAEDLVLNKIEPQQKRLFDTPAKALPAKRTRANRLTPTRMVSIMADVCRISDDEVRLSLVEKLTGETN